MSRILRLFLLITLLAQPAISRAQLQGQALIDSLLKELPQLGENPNKVRVLYALSLSYKTINPDAGIKYGQEELQLAKNLGLNKEILQACSAIGLNYQYKSDYVKAVEYYHKAINTFPADTTSLVYGNVISNLAYVYQVQENYQKALEYNLKSLSINIANADSFNIGGDFGNIGIIYSLKKDYAKALEYDFRSLKVFEQLRDISGVAHNYGNIGNVYKELNDYNKSIAYDQRAYQLFDSIGDKGGMAINLGNIATVYLTAANEYGTEDTHASNMPPGNKQILLSNAIDYFLRSIKLSEEIGQLDNIIEFSASLSAAYELSGNYKEALAYFRKHAITRDSVYSKENQTKLATLESERQLALKDKQIEIDRLKVAQKRNEQIIMGIALAGLLVAVTIILRKLYNQKKQNKQLALERQRHLERIEKQKTTMGDIAYMHSHGVRGEVATILGLVSVFNPDNYADPNNKIVIDGITETTARLDIIVKDMINKEDAVNSIKTGTNKSD